MKFMLKCFFGPVLLFFGYTSSCQIVYFADAYFKYLVVSNHWINTNGDNEIQVSEAEAFAGYLNVHSQHITDLTGIEAFINITDLRVNDNDLTSLDLSANVHLKELHCQQNYLTSLDLNANTELTMLRCQENRLTSLDVSMQEQLWYLECSENNLESIRLSTGSILRRLYCEKNNLDTLDLSSFRLLERLRVQDNDLVTLNLKNGHNERLELFDATENPALTCMQVDDPDSFSEKWSGAIDEFVSVSDSCRTVVYVPDQALLSALLANPKINTNQNEYIEYQEAESYTGNINVNKLKISDLTGIEAFVQLKGLYFSNNKVTSADLSHLSDLKVLECNNNPLTELDVGSNHQLVKLRAMGCTLSTIDVTDNTALEYLDLTYNSLSALDLSQNKSLKTLYCSYNALTSLDLSELQALNVVYAFYNRLTSLDLSGDTSLAVLNLVYNDLVDLDLTALTGLRELYAGSNSLVAVTLPATSSLTTIWVSHNRIGTLDLSQCPMVSVLRAEANALDHLDLRNGGNANMTDFVVKQNYLSCVEVDDSVYFQTNWPSDHYSYVTQDCNRDEIYIPDPNLRSAFLYAGRGGGLYSTLRLDKNMDEKIWVCEANLYLGPLNASGRGITDASGIEYFPELKEIYLEDNPLLTAVDVTNNKKLTKLSVNGNTSLTSLDVSHNPDLLFLGFQHTGISSIDVSHNAELRVLDAQESELTGTLDLRANTWLTELDCRSNHLDSILFSGQPQLGNIKCAYNNLQALNLTGMANLKYVNAIENNLTCIEVDDPEYSLSHWTYFIDKGVSFSEDCDGDAARIAESEKEQESDFRIFPNPVKDQLVVVGMQELTSVKVYSLAGMEQTVTITDTRIDCSDLCAGVYVVQVSDGKRTYSSRVVKQ